MKILILCHDIPSMTVGATIPIYYMIKELSKEYTLDLISFNSGKYSIEPLKHDLNKHIQLNNPSHTSFKNQLIYTLKNMISFDNLKTRSILNYYYNKNMNKLIQENLYGYDLIITDMPMAFYVKDSTMPKIVYSFDAVSDYNYKMYKKSENIISKMYWYLNYIKIHRYEKCYNNFDSCIVVNKKDKLLLEKNLKVKTYVVPNGVDTSYFKNDNTNEDVQLVFLGDMSTPPNNDAIRYFMNEIYPLIIKQKKIKFYIVGRNPSDYIKSLESDDIIVTGSVKDVRKYLTKESIFITPMISGTGIKNKILEAMSMELPVISTSIGISGIDAKDNIEFILADSPIEFEEHVIELIENKNLRDTIGKNARLLVKEEYSWENSSDKIKKIIKLVTR